MFPINFDIFGYQVRGYEGHWVLGILVMGFFYQRHKSLRAGYSNEWFVNAYSVAILMGFVFARLFHYLFWDTATFLNNPLVLFQPSGGFAILGGTIGTGFGGWLYCQLTGKNFLHWCDSLMRPIALGLCLSRFSCFLNGDAYGNPTNSIFGVVFSENSVDWMERWNGLHALYATSENPLAVISNLFLGQVNLIDIPVPKSMESLRTEGFTNLAQLSSFYPPVATGDYKSVLVAKGLFPFPVIAPPVHPAQLYEVFLMAICYILIVKLESVEFAKRKLFFVFWMYYGFNRFIIEFFRGDRNIAFADLTYAQLISLGVLVSGMMGFFYFTWKWKKYGMPEVKLP